MVSLCLAPSLGAQASPGLGARLRVWTWHAPVKMGALAGETRDSLTLWSLPDQAVVRLAWTEIRRIEQFQGIHDHGLLGGLLGAGGGLLLGAYFGARTRVGELSSSTTGVAGGMLGATLGGLWGSLVGTLTPSESWRPVRAWGAGSLSVVTVGVRMTLPAIH